MTYQPSKSPLLKYYKTLGGNALGRWIFSKAVCTAAPYFWWIPVGMNVAYLKMAKTDRRVERRPYWRGGGLAGRQASGASAGASDGTKQAPVTSLPSRPTKSQRSSS